MAGPTKKKKVYGCMKDYTDAHKKVPGGMYTFRKLSIQKTKRGYVKKNNFAPLGRPPSDRASRAKYNHWAKVSTDFNPEESKRLNKNRIAAGKEPYDITIDRRTGKIIKVPYKRKARK